MISEREGNLMEINKEYISSKNTYAGKNNVKYIVIHETDNFAKGAGARRHAEAQFLGHLSTSVQYCRIRRNLPGSGA